MTEKFVPQDGRPLTSYEREILTILQEECAEVIVAASKVLRFGLGNTNPDTHTRNDVELSLEVGDLLTMIGLISEAKMTDDAHVERGGHRKVDRLRRFLQNALSGQ